SPEVPVMAATPVQTHVHPNPTLQPQVVSPAHSYQDEIPVFDSSWTIVNDGMGESILIQQPSSNEAAALPPQNTQES
ncbi:hypothetical protein L9G16_20885, partial [Shewanella sp. A25]|nr:hypothetical protein [Shewanella shenzhenensis]